MQISPKGIDLVKVQEAYMKKLPDGRCAAYQDVLGHKNGKPILDKPTIGWGCTRGVVMGMIWTREQAEDGLRRELALHESIVNRIVTAEITQGMFDALVSFDFNCGRLSGSTLLKKLNSGDHLGAAAEFSRFTYASGVQLKTLVRRRAAEKAMFLSDLPTDDEDVEPEHCPQQADSGKPIGVIIKENKEAIGTVAAVATAGAGSHAVKSSDAPQAKQTTAEVLSKSQGTRQVIAQGREEASAWGGLVKDAHGLVGLPGLIVLGAIVGGFLLVKVIRK